MGHGLLSFTLWFVNEWHGNGSCIYYVILAEPELQYTYVYVRMHACTVSWQHQLARQLTHACIKNWRHQLITQHMHYVRTRSASPPPPAYLVLAVAFASPLLHFQIQAVQHSSSSLQSHFSRSALSPISQLESWVCFMHILELISWTICYLTIL